MLKKILVATDASEYSRQAFKSALELARNFHVEIEVLFVMYKPLVYDADLLGGEVIPPFQTELKSELVIESTLEGFDITGVTVTKKVVQGKPANLILREIEDENIDLVVMGSHGYGAIAGAILGSVSQRVLHGAKCSVLIAR
ncbi:MAG TPA: universal stress protein [Desulfosporosinus sp.]